MKLPDTSVWIDHFRFPDPVMDKLFAEREVLMHPHIVGELAMGQLAPRQRLLQQMRRLPQLRVQRAHDLLLFIEDHELYGLGIGFIDAHLLFAVYMTAGVQLWTRDKRLRRAAEKLSVAADLM